MTHPFPVARWVALAWLVFFVPYNCAAHGAWNLAFFCDVAVLLTCIGIWRPNALLLSSQALSSILIQCVWTLDLLLRLYTGWALVPGNTWMLNPEVPLFFRTVSLYHVVWPLLLLWCLSRVGYDRRALAWQGLIAVAALSVGRLAPAAMNVNCAHDLFGHSWRPAWLHLAIVVGALVLLVYWPTHVVLRWLFRPSAPTSSWARPSAHPASWSSSGSARVAVGGA
jgi:hypothetical protein